MNNNIKEGTKVFLPLGVVFACIFAALSFVRNGDVARITQAEVSIKENAEKIHKIEMEQAQFRIEQANQIKVLEEVRLDVKVLLAEIRKEK